MEFVVIWVVMATIVAMVAGSKGRSLIGWFLYGLLIWPVALVHAIVTKPEPQYAERRALESGDMRNCPQCAEVIRREANVCRYCGRDVEPQFRDPQPEWLRQRS